MLEKLLESRILEQLLSGVFNGMSIGSVLLIAALGLAVVFGLMGVINLAHGELMMLGAYTTFVVQNGFKNFLGESWFSFYIFAAVPLAFLVAALVGLLLERGVIRYLYGRPLETLLATWGVSLILQQFVRSINSVMVVGIALFCLLFFGAIEILRRRANWQRIRGWAFVSLLPLALGIAIATATLLANRFKLKVTQPWFGAQNVDVTAPAWLRGGLKLGEIKGAGLQGAIAALHIGEIQLPYTRLFIIALTILCVLGLYWFLQGSAWGLRIRAVTQNRDMSACLGIPTRTVDALTFAIGSGLAGIAGCAVSLVGSVGPNTGQNYIVNTFMVVVVGGVGKLVGSIVAALSIGMADYLIGAGIFTQFFQESGLLPSEPLQAFFEFFSQSSMSKVMVFALIIAFLQVRPAGLFPQKGRAVDA